MTRLLALALVVVAAAAPAAAGEPVASPARTMAVTIDDLPAPPRSVVSNAPAALGDPAYAHADDYVGAWGISWLHHWEITAGRRRTPSPDPPAWVLEAHSAFAAR